MQINFVILLILLWQILFDVKLSSGFESDEHHENNSSSSKLWKQSPIDINDATFWSALKPPILEKITNNNDRNSENYTLFLDSHSVSLHVPWNSWRIVYYEDKDINDQQQPCLQFHGVHWHWGDSNDKGSEHHLNGKAYAAEAHFVAWNCALYKNYTDAVHGPDGLSAFGLFLDVVEDDEDDVDVGGANLVLKNLTESYFPLLLAANYNENQEKSLKIPPVDMKQLFPYNNKRFYRYEGSLTTGTWGENVLWTVFHDPMRISKRQIKQFRQLPVSNNFRSIQPLNTNGPHTVKRYIFKSFASHGERQLLLSVGNYLWFGLMLVFCLISVIN